MKTDLNRADGVIRNVKVFNSYFKRFDDADVYWKDGKFLYIDRVRRNEISAEMEIDGKERYMIPGLIDIHMHIESSLVTPEAFAKWTVRNGLTTIVSEPHEIANVTGMKGIQAMIESGKNSPYDCFYAIPSNVPIMPRQYETSGATITAEDMKELKETDGIICLGEVMNFREIIRENDSEVGKFIDEIHDEEMNYPLEGHCPALIDSDLAKFAYLGIQSDHCDHNLEELKQRFENGIFIQLQDLMVTPDVIRYVMENNLYEYFSFVTDDTFPDILYHKGHVDAVMRKAISYGMRPEDAIYCTTYTPSRRMNLLDRGVIAPGRLADFVLLDDLKNLHIVNTFKRGECIFDISDPVDVREDYSLKEENENTVHSRLLNKEDFRVTAEGEDREVMVRVMEVNAQNNRTAETFFKMKIRNHELLWKEAGVCLVMVVERHGRDNHISYGFAQGSVIHEGAISSSYSHDSHNLIVMGKDEEDMRLAINRIISLQGGINAVREQTVLGEIELPIAGLLSRKSVKKTSEDFETLRAAFDDLGYVHRKNIMNFCLLSLTCIPELKLTDRGYMNTVTLEMVPLYEEVR